MYTVRRNQLDVVAVSYGVGDDEVSCHQLRISYAFLVVWGKISGCASNRQADP